MYLCEMFVKCTTLGLQQHDIKKEKKIKVLNSFTGSE